MYGTVDNLSLIVGWSEATNHRHLGCRFLWSGDFLILRWTVILLKWSSILCTQVPLYYWYVPNSIGFKVFFLLRYIEAQLWFNTDNLAMLTINLTVPIPFTLAIVLLLPDFDAVPLVVVLWRFVGRRSSGELLGLPPGGQIRHYQKATASWTYHKTPIDVWSSYGQT